MRPSRLLDAAARARLEAAVVEAERATAGEIVLCVVRSSDAWEAVGWRLGVLLAALAFLGMALFGDVTSPVALLGVEAAALAGGLLLARVDTIRRRLVTPEAAAARAYDRARRAFREHGLARTIGRTGILIFVSLFERRVVVLGDVGIDRALGPGESWEQVVEPAVAGLREGHPVEGLEAAVRRCGQILAAHLPAPPRDLNELPDPVVFED